MIRNQVTIKKIVFASEMHQFILHKLGIERKIAYVNKKYHSG